MEAAKISTKHNKYWTFKLIELSFVSLVKKWSLYLYVLLTITIAIFASVIFLPYELMGGVFYLFAMMFPVLLILGQSSYTIKQSTIYENIATSGINKLRFYSSQLIISLIFTFMISIIFWLSIFLIGLFPVFLDGWMGNAIKVNPFVNPFTNQVIAQNLLYITFISSFVTFSVYFLVQQFVNSSLYYNMTMFSLLVIGLIFSGSLNNFFEIVYGSNSAELIIGKNMFPTTMFIPSLFVPSFGLGQFTTASVTQNSMPVITTFVSRGLMENINLIFYSFKNNWQWTMVLLQPYLIFILYISIGILTMKIKGELN